jgi:hypothetical protein
MSLDYSKTNTRTFEFYNHNERYEVMNALNLYQRHLDEKGMDPIMVRPETLNRLIDDFQEFVLAN